jgi:hypothetical protein
MRVLSRRCLVEGMQQVSLGMGKAEFDMKTRPREILGRYHRNLRGIFYNRRHLLALVAFAVTGVIGSLVVGSPAGAGEPRAVLELFTSQGCSSCPAADRLVGELTKDPSVIALSVPIDYWDYLGWKDTLASPKNTSRQRGYARVRGDRQIYTPQMVINGRVHALGSDKAAIERAIVSSRDGTAMSVSVKVAITGGTVNVNIAADAGAYPPGEVWLCAVSRRVPVEIAKGENRGHTVVYNNVVRNWLKLGDWDGKAGSWSVPVAQFKTGDVDAAVIVVQGGATDRPGAIFGAAFAALPAAF